jgi:hypothetical protein
MRVASSADWRDALPFETPVPAAEVAPGDPARCSGCGPDVSAWARTELFAVKHRHPKHHSGFVRFYCATHVPVIQRPTPPAPSRPARPARAARPAAEPRTPPRRTADERPRPVCPDCFVEVAASGECGMCGQRIG